MTFWAPALVGIAGAAADDSRLRLLVTTDIGGDPDDEQSLRRLLAYANEFRIVGLIASAGTDTNPAAPQPAVINEVITDYGTVVGNLGVHAAGYPSASALSLVVKSGGTRGDPLVSSATPPTTGSAWIIAKVDESTEPLCISIWGAALDTAQAILSASIAKSAPDFAAFKAKLRIYTIYDQDAASIAWIRANHPDVWMIWAGEGIVPSQNSQYRAIYQNDSNAGVPLVDSGLFSLVFTPWVTSNVHGHGALGAGYPTAVDQNPDTANNHTVAEGGGVKEGDTPAWFYFLKNGLNNPSEPTWGGWGGLLTPSVGGSFKDGAEEHPLYPVQASNPTEWRKWPIAKWRQDYQHDFQARMDWCAQATFAAANHHPVAMLNSIGGKDFVAVAADGGATVNLTAAGSTDPDGNALSYSWSHYKGVGGSYTGTISITGATSQACSFTAPAASTTVHVILKVTDNGTPNLVSYRRAVVTVAGFEPSAWRTFNGTSQYASITEVVTFPFSMSVWANFDDLATTQVLMAITNSGSTSNFHSLNMNTTDSLIWGETRDSSGVSHISKSAAPPPTGSWVHVGIVVSAANSRKIYLNGVPGTTPTTTASVTGQNRTVIGASIRTTVGGYFRGKLAHPAVWSSALSDANMLSLASGALPSTLPTNLWGYWPLAGTASPEPDTSGNARNMTLTGF